MSVRKKSEQTPWPETLWTIGHSTRSLDEFLALRKGNAIAVLAGVRHYSGSRKYPHFNVVALQEGVQEAGIRYEAFTELGGRRKVQRGSPNTAGRHPALRGYADYMQTKEFRDGIERLKALASKQRTAIMCSEAVWWRCHRGLVSDLFKLNGTRVLHIMGPSSPAEHPYTSAAHVVDGHLDYSGDQHQLPLQ